MLKKTSQYHLIYAILALGIGCSACNSEPQQYEGWLKYDSKACVNSGGIYDSHDANREKSTCECNDKSGVVCYESWLCDQDNNSCKECKAGESTCFNGVIRTCMQGHWTDGEKCESGKCNKDNTACMAESLCETKCENNILTTCSNNDEQEDKYNQVKTQCPYGCDGKRCKSCDESYKCDNNTLTRCGVKIVECKNGCDNVNGTDVCIPDKTIPGWDEKCQPNESKCIKTDSGAKQYQCVEGHWSEVIGAECTECSADGTVCAHCTENKCDGDKLKMCIGGKYEEEGKPTPECSCQDGAWNCPGECPADMPEGKKNCTCDKTKGEWTDCQDEPGEKECPADMPEGKKDCTCDKTKGEWTDCQDDVPEQGQPCSEEQNPVCKDENHKIYCGNSTADGSWKWLVAKCDDNQKCMDGECKCTKNKCEGNNFVRCNTDGTWDDKQEVCSGECDEVKGCIDEDNPCKNIGDGKFSCIGINGDGLSMCFGNSKVTVREVGNITCDNVIDIIKDKNGIIVTIDGADSQSHCYTYFENEDIAVLIRPEALSSVDEQNYFVTYCANGCNDEGSCNIVTTNGKCDERSYFCDEHVLKCMDGSEEKIVSSGMVSHDDSINKYLDYCLKKGDEGYNCVQNVPSNEGKKLKDVCHPDGVEVFCHDDKAYLFDFPNTGLNIKDCAYCESVDSEWKFIPTNECRCEDIDKYPQCDGSENQLICQDGMIKSEPCGKNGICEKDLKQCMPKSGYECIDGYLRCNIIGSKETEVEVCVNGGWQSTTQKNVVYYENEKGGILFTECTQNGPLFCSGDSCTNAKYEQYDRSIKNKTSFSIPWELGLKDYAQHICIDSLYHKSSELGSNSAFMLDYDTTNKQFVFTYCKNGCKTNDIGCNP